VASLRISLEQGQINRVPRSSIAVQCSRTKAYILSRIEFFFSMMSTSLRIIYSLNCFLYAYKSRNYARVISRGVIKFPVSDDIRNGVASIACIFELII